MAAGLFLFLLGLAITPSEAVQNTTTFTANSSYQFNVNLLLSSLASNSARSNKGFYNTTIGQTPDDTVYGLFLCRGDVSTDICQDCVTFATQDAAQRFPVQNVTAIWYDECLLHYSNQSFFNNVKDASRMMYTTQKRTHQPINQDLLRARMNGLASQASSSSKMFAVRAESFPWSYRTLYTLAQCTQDLSESNCQICLESAIAALPNGSIGAKTLMRSCIVRYETYLFYDQSAAPTLPDLLPPLPSSPSPSPSPSSLYLPPPPLYLPPLASGKGNF